MSSIIFETIHISERLKTGVFTGVSEFGVLWLGGLVIASVVVNLKRHGQGVRVIPFQLVRVNHEYVIIFHIQ
jgi:hypothetical protein